MEYNMHPFMEQRAESYLLLAQTSKSDLRPAKTPFLDETKLEGDDSKPGALRDIACKVLMKILYSARLARFDLLRAGGALATEIIKWESKCDRHVGDSADQLQLTLYNDADFAGFPESAKSTS
eukprot:9401775-Heterocapsa_arctica.AAC.1